MAALLQPRGMSLQNLSEIVVQRAQTQADDIAYRFFQGASLEPEVLTFHGLWQRAAALAARLQHDGLAGARVLLACKSQKLFVIGFFGCLLAGCAAVPTPPPRRKALAGRLQLLASDAAIGALLTDSDQIELEPGLPVIDLAAWEASAENGADLAAAAQRWTMPALQDDSLAFLQYTSGSTSDPKGVVVLHGNLMRNCAAIQQGMGFTPASSILTALPLFHDMGLVGGVLESMYVGCIGNCMPPAEFVQYPERWLRIIAQFGITISGGPNFMYELAARNVTPEQLAGCDFSRWEVAFCGAEPIRASTIARFTAQFAPFGFRPQSFYPCYGMAESTLFITGKRIDQLPEVCSHHGGAVVNCGLPRLDTQVAIVDPVTLGALPELAVGEIWVAGGSVAGGYWRNPELTAQVFGARIAGGPQQSYLRTGDLGYLKRGELYVTGRLKDLLVVYGKKYAPHDIEAAAEASHEALREAGGAAFCFNDDGGDRLLLAFELKREWLRRGAEWPEVKNAMRRAVSAAHGVAIDEIVLIKPGSLPRTSSGKVRRQQCRSDYLAGLLDSAG